MQTTQRPVIVRSLSSDQPVESLPRLLNEMEFALVPLYTLRDGIIEEQWSDQVVGILGLYIRHMEQLVMKGRELVGGPRLSRQDPRASVMMKLAKRSR